MAAMPAYIGRARWRFDRPACPTRWSTNALHVGGAGRHRPARPRPVGRSGSHAVHNAQALVRSVFRDQAAVRSSAGQRGIRRRARPVVMRPARVRGMSTPALRRRLRSRRASRREGSDRVSGHRGRAGEVVRPSASLALVVGLVARIISRLYGGRYEARIGPGRRSSNRARQAVPQAPAPTGWAARADHFAI